MSYTKGPWRVEYQHGETHLVANGEVIMCDMTYYPWVPDNDADWHLIAAAPELLEALRGMIRMSELSGTDDRIIHLLALSAIAKAEGKPQ